MLTPYLEEFRRNVVAVAANARRRGSGCKGLRDLRALPGTDCERPTSKTGSVAGSPRSNLASSAGHVADPAARPGGGGDAPDGGLSVEGQQPKTGIPPCTECRGNVPARPRPCRGLYRSTMGTPISSRSETGKKPTSSTPHSTSMPMIRRSDAGSSVTSCPSAGSRRGEPRAASLLTAADIVDVGQGARSESQGWPAGPKRPGGPGFRSGLAVVHRSSQAVRAGRCPHRAPERRGQVSPLCDEGLPSDRIVGYSIAELASSLLCRRPCFRLQSRGRFAGILVLVCGHDSGVGLLRVAEHHRSARPGRNDRPSG